MCGGRLIGPIWVYNYPTPGVSIIEQVRAVGDRVHIRLATLIVTHSSHNGDPETIALAAVEVSRHIQIVLLTFKALHGVVPNYLNTLLQSYIPSS